MEASAWQCRGYLRDDTSKARGSSAGTREDSAPLQLGREGLGEGLERGDVPEPRSKAPAPAEKPEGCGRRREGEAPPKVYEMEVGHGRAGTGRTVRPVVYRLEESEYRRLLEEAEAEPEEEWEAMEYEAPAAREGYPGDGKAASASPTRLNALPGGLRRRMSRSDSESSAESRQVSRLTLNSPSEGNKPSVPVRSDSFERNALLMDYILQSKQEAAAAASYGPRESGKAAESFRQAVSFIPRPDGAPDLRQNGHAGEEDPARKPEPDKQVAKSLERTVSAVANYASAAGDAAMLLEGRERLGGEADAGMLGLYSPKKTPPAPPVRSHSKESLALSMSRTVAMTEALLEPRGEAAKLAKEPWAAAGAEQRAGGWTAGGEGSEEPEQKGTKSQEDEKVLKVADAKKTFEKPKAAEGKAATPSPSAAKKGEA